MTETGKLTQTILQCVFIGPPRIGKSSLIRRLTGKTPIHLSSTGAADKPIQVCIRKLAEGTLRISDHKWSELNFSEEIISLIMDISCRLKVSNQLKDLPPSGEEDIHQFSPSAEPEASVTKGTSDRKDTEKDAKEAKQASVESTKQLDAKHTSFSASPASGLPQSTDVTLTSKSKSSIESLKDTFREGGWATAKMFLEESTMVYLTDTGGQVEFQELLPVLVSGPSVFFLVFNLNQKLDDRFDVEYVLPSGETTESYKSTFKVEEALFQSLASILCMGSYTQEGLKAKDQAPPSLKVFFVGTHKDLVTPDQISQINYDLKEKLKCRGLYKKKIIQFATKDCIIFTVDNFTQKEDESGIGIIRERVEHIRSLKEFKVTAPPQWMIFGLAIRNQKKHLLKLKQCLAIAKECGINDHEVMKAALWFLHNKVGLVRYFQGENIVIPNPQVLFDKITELIVDTFTFEKVGKDNPSACDDFEEKGVFFFSAFERITGNWTDQKELLTAEMLVKLLERLHIIARLEHLGDDKKYFMPCVLCHADPPLSSPQSDIPPLLVTFKCGFFPKGLFAVMVVNLINFASKTEKESVKWEFLEDKIYRDQISFKVGHYEKVKLRAYPTFMEICISDSITSGRKPEFKTREDICGEIRQRIIDSIRNVKSELNYTHGATPSLTFYCPDHPSDHPAKASYDNDDDKPCSLCCPVSEDLHPLPDRSAIWFASQVCIPQLAAGYIFVTYFKMFFEYYCQL